MKTIPHHILGFAGIPNRYSRLELPRGHWLLMEGTRVIRPVMMNAIARVAMQEEVTVLDGARLYHAATVTLLVNGSREAVKRVHVIRADTCQQMAALLEECPAVLVPFIVLDLLHPFRDVCIHMPERRKLLQACLDNLDRLAGLAGGMVSITLEKVQDDVMLGLPEKVESAAVDVIRMEMFLPGMRGGLK